MVGKFFHKQYFLHFCIIVLCLGKEMDEIRKERVFRLFVSKLFFCLLRVLYMDERFGGTVGKCVFLKCRRSGCRVPSVKRCLVRVFGISGTSVLLSGKVCGTVSFAKRNLFRHFSVCF